MIHAVLAGMLLVQPVPGAKAGAPVKDSGVLAGPKVEQSARATLVRRDADGRVERPETPVEVGAARLLELPADVRVKVDEILAARARFLEKFIGENLELLGELDTAGKAGDKVDQAKLGVRALSKLAPMMKEGSLRAEIRGVLAEGARERYDALLKEYWDAVVEQEKKAAPSRSRFEIVTAERFQAFAREGQAAFQRLEKSGTLLFYYFFKDVALSDEQAGKIRGLLDEFVEETKGAPTKAQEQKIFLAVMGVLDVRQQTELVRRFKEREGGVKGKKKEGVTTPRGGVRSPARGGR